LSRVASAQLAASSCAFLLIADRLRSVY